jgi:HAD superfamily hydrolase (TIGR01509 family)
MSASGGLLLTYATMTIDAVVFDLDGVILESEQVWHTVRRDFARALGAHWDEQDQVAVMGANSMQWAAHMREKSGIGLSDRDIYAGVIGALRDWYARDLPLIPGATDAILRLADDYSLGVASSSPRELIEYALELAGVRSCFAAVVSSDEVAQGKPAPDVYLEACARMGTSTRCTAAVEDSENGLRAAAAAGLAVIAVPNPDFPPSARTMGVADAILRSIVELTADVVAALRQGECGGD